MNNPFQAFGKKKNESWVGFAARQTEKTARLIQTALVSAIEPVDFIATPARKLQEAIVGHAIPKVSESIKNIGGEYKPEKGVESWIHEGAKYAASVPAMGAIGLGVKGAFGSAKFLPNFAKETGEWIGGKLLGGEAAQAAVRGAPKELMGMTALGVPLGMGSSAIQEHVISNPLIADVASAVALTLGPKAVKGELHPIEAARNIMNMPWSSVKRRFLENLKNFVGEENIDEAIKRVENYVPPIEGYEGTLAQKVYSPHDDKSLVGFAQAERAVAGSNPSITDYQRQQKEHLKESFQDMYRGDNPSAAHELIQAERAGDQAALENAKEMIEPSRHWTIEDVGENIREAILDKVGKLREKRAEITDPYYKKLEMIQDRAHDMTDSHKIVQEYDHTGVQESVKHDYNRFKEMTNKVNRKGEPVDSLEDLDKVGPTISQMTKLRQDFSKYYTECIDSGNYRDARVYKEMRNALDEDIGRHTDLGDKAKKLYHKLSLPVNFIEEQKALRKSLSFSRGVAQEAQTSIANDFIKGMKSRENVRHLRQALGEEGSHMDILQDYGKQKLLHDLVDDTGSMASGKVKGWMDTHGGLLESNPLLKDALSDLKSTQKILSEKAGRKKHGLEDIYAEAPNPEKFVERTLVGDYQRDKSIKEVLDRLSHLESEAGEGRKSYLSGVLDHMYKNLLGSGEHMTYHRFNDYMKTYGSVLKKHLPEEQFNTINQIGKALESQRFAESAGHGHGSHTTHIANIHKDLHAGDEKALFSNLIYGAMAAKGVPTPAIKYAGNKIEKSVKEKHKKWLHDVFTNKEEGLKALQQAKDIGEGGFTGWLERKIPQNTATFGLAGSGRKDYTALNYLEAQKDREQQNE